MQSRSILKTLALLFVVCMTLLGACSGGSTGADGPKKAALEGLVSVREMAADSDFEVFGYKAQADVGTEQLGSPFSIRDLDMEALLSSAVPTEALIIDNQEYLFPVLVREESVSSLRVGRQDDGNWTLTALEADAYEIELAAKAIQSHSFDRASCYLLDLPEIELLMLGCQRNGALRLLPLYAPSPAFVIDTEYRFADIIGAIKTAVLAAKQSPVRSVVAATPLLSAVQSPQPVSKAALGPVTNKLLPVKLIAQEQTQWCWAATAQMTRGFKPLVGAKNPSQCTQASNAQDDASFLDGLVRKDCCANNYENAGNLPCNGPFAPYFEQGRFTRTLNRGVPSWEQLKALIDRDQPLAFLWKWKPIPVNDDGPGHYMVAIGYKETLKKDRFVVFLDPSPVGQGETAIVPYHQWVGGASTMYKHFFRIYFTD